MTEQELYIVVAAIIVFLIRTIQYLRMSPEKRQAEERKALDSMSLFPKV
jgi:hypothetical protein